MKLIPQTKNTPVLRTDFTDPSAWDALVAALRKPVGGFYANLNFIADREFDGVTPEQLAKLIPLKYDQAILIIADRTALTHPDHPLLVLDLPLKAGRQFRAIASQVQAIENNLSIANLDFEDFAMNADEDGIFRGFPLE
jgi:hypothetical protein